MTRPMKRSKRAHARKRCAPPPMPQALSALVNLAQDDEARAAMQKLRAVPRVMDAIREKSCQHLHLLVSG